MRPSLSRSRSGKSVSQPRTTRSRHASAPQLECLESRTLLSAGMLDPTFGMGGKATSSFQGLLTADASGSVLQADGKIVTVGLANPVNTDGLSQFGLTRTNPDGSLDSAFGNSGRVLTHFDVNLGANPVSAVLQPDRKIVVVGTTAAGNLAMARFNPDGSLDSAFGTGGLVAPAIQEISRGLVLQPDGKILVVLDGSGADAMGDATSRIAVVRFNTNGTLDTSFGQGGGVNTLVSVNSPGTVFGNFTNEGRIALGPDGRIVVAADISTSSPSRPPEPGPITTHSIFLARFNSDGSVDSTFGQMGAEGLNAVGFAEPAALTVQPDNKIVVVGSFGVARLNPDGSLDTTFNQTGIVMTMIESVALQPDNKIVAAGPSFNIANEIVVDRYNPNGSLDTTFGQGGMMSITFGAMGSTAHVPNLFLQTGGKTVVSATVSIPNESTPNESTNEAALARLNPDGSLDNTFGSNNQIIVDFPHGFAGPVAVLVNAVAVQADGKIVVAGNISTASMSLAASPPGNITSIAVARFNHDRSIDTTFGQGGFDIFPVTNFGSSAAAVAIQADGKIIVGGTATVSLPVASPTTPGTTEFVTARLNPDGHLDTTFGNQGLATLSGLTNLTNQSVTSLTGLVIQPDGKIVDVGQLAFGADMPPETVAVRYNVNGSPDASFGTNGVAATPGPQALSRIVTGRAALQADGKIDVVATGTDGVTSGLVRFNANGTLDTTFGTHGFTAFSGTGAAVAVQPDGKIVEVGLAVLPRIFLNTFAVERYNSDGSVDTSFGSGGVVETDFGGSASATSIIVQPNGKILVGGVTDVPTPNAFALARYNPNGSLDTGFGSGGTVTTGFDPTVGAGINDMALQPDGALVAAGSTELPPPFQGLPTADLARFLLSPSQNELFVDQVYRDLLNRQVDPTGLSVFLNALDEGAVTRTQVAQIIESSQEYRTDLVQGFYQSFLHRAADTGGLQAWVSALNGGATIEQVKAGFLGSQEYFQDHGGSNDLFLQAAYQDVLGRSVDATGAAAWSAQLAADTPRAMVAAAILASPEAENDLINSVYMKYLRRAPDPSGTTFWLMQLQQGLRDEDFIAGVVGSPEYFGRV